jgi:DNA-binding transcriptional LysR family regulator
MDIRHLRYFIAVAENLNFTMAAKLLHISQPSLSKQISDLEIQIDLQLFVRNTRGVELTAAGAALLEEANAIVTRSETAVAKARLAAAGNVGNLRIGFLGPFEKQGLSQLIRKFRHNCPKSNISFNKLNWNSLNEALENGKLDIAFTPSYGLDKLYGISWEKASDSYPLSIVVAPEHPLADKTSICLSTLANESFLILPRTEYSLAYDHMRQLCIASGFRPKIIAYPPDLETLLLLVATGVGITMHSKLTDFYAGSNLHYLNIEGCSFAFDFAMAWRTTNSNPLIPLFLATLRKENFLIR